MNGRIKRLINVSFDSLSMGWDTVPAIIVPIDSQLHATKWMNWQS